MPLTKLNVGKAYETQRPNKEKTSWDLMAHPVTQVIGEQALVDILELSEVAWTCWGVSTPRSGLGLKMVKELDLQLALGMNERRKTGSLPVYDTVADRSSQYSYYLIIRLSV